MRGSRSIWPHRLDDVPFPRRPHTPARRRAAVAAIAALPLILLAGCTAAPDPTPAPTTTAPAPTPTETTPAVLDPEGTAEEAMPSFDAAVAQVWAGTNPVSSLAYIDALVAAGFDKAAMQATNDISTVGYAAESIQFSVRWGDADCLIGQVGPSTGDQPVTAIMPQLADGRCLVGETMPLGG